MLIIGLTGSIATGKSTVSRILAAEPYNLPIIDADLLARQVVQPGTPAYKAIVARFGSSTSDLLLPPEEDVSPQDGTSPEGRSRPSHGDASGRPLNRAALGRRVFGDSPTARADRAALNAIVHPAVRRAMLKQALAAYVRGRRAVVLDVPLLFESGLDALCGAVVVVSVRDPAVQMARLRRRDAHLSEAEARDRVASQGDVREKARRCQERGPGRGVVVWNDGSEEELRDEVAGAIAALRNASPRWWSVVLLACPPLAVVVAAWTYWQNRRIDRRWRETELRERAKL